MSLRCTPRLSLAALWLAGLLGLPWTLFGQTAAPQPTPAAASANAVPIVIELFTSEGCSSCPPADGILQRLDEFQPIAGAQLIVLSEHVTYWDHDGWKDPNSASAFTDRQSSYEGVLGLKEPYTPQMIVDGTKVVNLETLQQFEGILNQAKASPKIPVRVGDLIIDPADATLLRTHVETDANSADRNADVYVALALNHVESQVLHGENGGKHLVHVAVVQQLTKVGKLSKGKAFAEDVKFKLKPGTDPKNVRVVAFVQEPGPGKLVGAALRRSAN